MEGGIVTDIIVPLCLAAMMVGLGVTLVPDDFRRVLVYPKSTALGLALQMIVLPLVGFVLASLVPLTPEARVGIVLLTACPGGVASNVIVHLAKGDTALAVTLTVVSSALSLITIPLYVGLALQHFMGMESSIRLPVWDTVIKVFILTVPTVAAGMLWKWRSESVAEKAEKPIRIGGLLFLVLLVVGVGISERDIIFEESLGVGPVTLALCVSTTLIGYIAARAAAIAVPAARSIAICTGFQNSALALVIATSFLESAEIAIPPAVYTVVMYLTAGVWVAVVNYRNAGSNDQPPGQA